MRVLLDTSYLYDLMETSGKFSDNERQFFAEQKAQLFVSAVSIWETIPRCAECRLLDLKTALKRLSRRCGAQSAAVGADLKTALKNTPTEPGVRIYQGYRFWMIYNGDQWYWDE